MSCDADILEQLLSSCAYLLGFILMSFGSCPAIFLSSELADGKDIFLVSSFSVCFILKQTEQFKTKDHVL